MAWSEWERAKDSAAHQRSSRTELNSVPSDPGGSGTLVSDRPAWARAGHGVGSLGEGIGKSLGQLAEGQDGLGGTSGCLTAQAQKDLYDSWEKYVKKVSKRCEQLADVLVKAGNDELKTEEAIKAEIGNMKAAYADTAPVGGQGK
ncbi:hypothetical protein [Streptomyces sp. NPDC056160]|uniref:hypothetical protein n=1 Tax=Streptomyces sp. NPDC056160 TaxID=3345731 RepID=UPI0035D54985